VTTFDFDAAWTERQVDPFTWRVHGDVEVEMPGSRPAGLVLHLWRARQGRGDDAELSRAEMYVAAEMLFGPEVLGRLISDRFFTDDKLIGCVRAILAEYTRREVANPDPKAGTPGSAGPVT
jgi:hypothetical protein